LQAGGRGSDGKQRLREVVPSKLHHKLPVFLGSTLDIAELESYGDVQQDSSRQYSV
jgi:fructose-1,6-bisphosphatase I